MIGGRYELEREIARGGMGAVWLGSDVILGRTVAIKRVGIMPGGSSPDLMRAEREARIAASLSHPHIVGIYDLVHDQDQQWLVMEYVEGSTLAELVRERGRLSAPEAAAVLTQVASALQAAHAAGIVHRDVKPSNILVRPDGQAKLSDFGIARAEADASLTQTGLVTGSPAYLAPEVASGQQATPASDVWSLGATLFHALDGHPPYDVGENLLGALYRIVHEPPPRLADAGPMTPVLEATMTVEPADRWSMGQVERYLDSVRTGQPTAALVPPVSRPRSRQEHLGEVTEVLPAGATAAEPVRGAPVAGGTPHRQGPARRRILPVTIGLVIAALVVVIALIALSDDPQQVVDGEPDPAPTTSTGSPTPSTTPTAEATPDAAAMEQFATDYVATAASDPSAGFQLLTPAYQRASGGFDQYRDDFWGNVATATVLTRSADPDTLTVSYTYEVTFLNGSSKEEVVNLRLEYDADTDSYLIAGDAGT